MPGRASGKTGLDVFKYIGRNPVHLVQTENGRDAVSGLELRRVANTGLPSHVDHVKKHVGIRPGSLGLRLHGFVQGISGLQQSRCIDEHGLMSLVRIDAQQSLPGRLWLRCYDAEAFADQGVQ